MSGGVSQGLHCAQVGSSVPDMTVSRRAVHLLRCEWCGGEWATRKKSARTCSPKCRAALREAEKPSRGAPLREYPADIVADVVRMYVDEGMTVREVQDALPTGYKAQNIIERHIPERRVAAKRDQRGERNHMWRGDDANYQALHLRVQAERGKPDLCAACETTDGKFEWANLTGAYTDINDYIRLCLSCHRRFDAARRRQTGRSTRPEEMTANV